MTGSVLVLGDDARSCLSVVRSLGRNGLRVTLGFQDPDSPAARSRYAGEVIRFPSSSVHGADAWLERLKALLNERTFDLVIPTADNTLAPIVQHRRELEPLAKFAIPDDTGFLYSYQKHATLRLAEELLVPTPRTFTVGTADDVDAITSQANIRYPLIVKPDSSIIWSVGRMVVQKVSLAHDASQLREFCGAALGAGPVLVQEYFQGIGVGQEFLSRDGVILRAFQHERVHEPMGGGGSSYRKSVELDSRMLACSEKMLAHLKWTGVAMVEYKLSPDTGQFVLMEINGRFWGSLPLALAAGADFPWDLYRLIVEGQPPANTDYKIGVHSRNLITDLNWFRRNWTADPSDPFQNVRPRGLAIRDMVRMVNPWEHLDTTTLDDPRPGIFEFARLFAIVGNLVTDQVRKRMLTVAANLPAWRQRQRSRLCTVLAGHPQLLFVCKGNICRSPFASAYAQLKLAELGVTDVGTSSSGMYPQADRPAPDTAISAAAEFGVDLSAHRSSVLTEAEIERCGAVFCMDYQNYGKLLAQHPRIRPRLFFLKPFDPGGRGYQIQDPWNQPAETFRACYREIAASVDELLRQVIGQ